ncbi:hypothetical protein P153DRAFT_301489 [Dothidotthia symphoricarpi CBS 119687]|uniref:BTB domain-containing protein n=1 Tax=Dothidotthia symphoricarpi CBS 119687 TaxID=1392245 RepID=A0A6A5ZZJ3_9PLEO|nr:uncharacterized protein P153DRAFT_301489 [Dothidotthia symphoricarpi CBS 119687]KAF2124706.1 hypothetical protein P153DRAFT_301489 [Dothidotthia symphoricarpi CBS 119687]
MCTSHTATEQHRNKRQFQSSITSFFARADFDEADDLRGDQLPTTRPQQHARATQQQHQQRDSLAPAVPGQVQTDLLSVGMRVRKSVSEGYKTQKMAVLPSLHTAFATSMFSARNTGLEVKPPRDPVEDAFHHQRELLPFCGLHKIGGYAEQPTTNIHLYAGTDSCGQRSVNMFPFPAETFTQPFSNRSSADPGYETTSLRPNPANPSKRSWQDENETLNPNFFFSVPTKFSSSDEDEPVSPMSETPPDMLPPVRLFAQPKSRRRLVGDRSVDVDMDLGSSGLVEGRMAAGCASDFEEADFLDGHEVDMAGPPQKKACHSIEQGPEQVDCNYAFYVHEKLLRSNSRFFENILEQLEGDQDRFVIVPNIKAETFPIWVKWVYTAKLFLTLEASETGQAATNLIEWSRWCDIYALGHILQDDDFKDAAIDFLINIMVVHQQIPYQLLRRIYSHSSKQSAHRKLAVDVFVKCRSRHCWGQDKEMSAAFSRDIIRCVGSFLGPGLELQSLGEAFDSKDTCKYHDHGPDKPCYKTRPAFQP